MNDEPEILTVLVPVREQAVDFYGDALLATQVADGTIYVPVRPIAEHLGLAWPGQFERLRRDPLLAPEIRLVSVTLMSGQETRLGCRGEQL